MRNVNSDLADFSVDFLRKLGADFAEAREEEYQSNMIIIKNGAVEIAGCQESVGIGVKFVVNGCYGFCSVNRIDRDLLKKVIEGSFRQAKKSSGIRNAGQSPNGEKAIKDISRVAYKTNPLDVPLDKKIGYIREMDKGLLSHGIKIPARFWTWTDGMVNKYYVNSEGSKILSQFPMVGLDYSLSIKIGNSMAQRYWQHASQAGWEAIKDWNLEGQLKEHLLALEDNARHGKKPPHGEIDLITGSEVTGIIAHESCGHPYEADRILGREAAQAGESFLESGSVGTRMGNEKLNLVDDPTAAGKVGSYKFDDEGIGARRKYLIKNGKVNEFLHNRSTSREMGVKSNGSARASSFDKDALVRMSNTFFLPGEQSFEELVEGVKSGIFMKNFTEWNIDDKRINQKYVGSEAYLIENGKIAGPVKSPVLEISTFKLYAAIDASSRDMFELHAATCGKGEPMQGLGVSMGGPCLRIKGIRLSN
ncbi:MAG: TldD protein [archaeon GW2011_AR3]|nr:MAG: TldD protein [archaeon GW2011_AR3]MBS3109396.1 TldD/PmbA family protein [Candidatus Woesearchaeota archaeon]